MISSRHGSLLSQQTRKDNNNEESLDMRINQIKQKNKEIIQRSEEVEKDKNLYG